jgi:hypothetical protein
LGKLLQVAGAENIGIPKRTARTIVIEFNLLIPLDKYIYCRVAYGSIIFLIKRSVTVIIIRETKNFFDLSGDSDEQISKF